MRSPRLYTVGVIVRISYHSAYHESRAITHQSSCPQQGDYPLQLLMPVASHSRRTGFERATHLVSLPEVFDLALE